MPTRSIADAGHRRGMPNRLRAGSIDAPGLTIPPHADSVSQEVDVTDGTRIERGAPPPGSTAIPAAAFTRTATFRTVVAGALSILLAVTVSPGLARRVPHYDTGQFTTAAIRAPYDFSVVDDAATTRKRADAARQAPVVVDVNGGMPAAIVAKVTAAFAPLVALVTEADDRRVPSAQDLEKLSAAQQANLRRRLASASDRKLARDLSEMLPKAESALDVSFTPDERAALAHERFGGSIQKTLSRLADDAYARPVVADRVPLDELARAPMDAGGVSRRIALRDSVSGAERVVADTSALRTVDEVRVAIQARADILAQDQPLELRRALVRVLQAQLLPNASYDSAATQAGQATAALSILPVSLNFRRNQLIIGEGQEVTAQTVLALRDLETRRLPSTFIWRFAGSCLTFFLLLLAGRRVLGSEGAGRVAADRDLMCAASGIAATAGPFWLWLLVADRVVAGSPATPSVAVALLFPLAVTSMLTRFVAGVGVSILQMVVTAVAVGLMAEPGVGMAAYVIVVGLVGIHAVGGCNSRACLMRAGLPVALAAGGAAFGLSLLMGLGIGATAVTVVASSAGGAVSGLLVIALAPAAERLFGYTTRISLVEMVSYEHPLLKRMAQEAPGTFQHSVSIGVLADAAAAAVDADPLLVRVGALYHDVGKILNRGLFVENQSSKNPHDELSPVDSARLILAHVPDGVGILGEYDLPDRIADFVREHHGTRLLSHFLDGARAAGMTCDTREFQYAGPRPRSRETAILMIADQVEATSRTISGADADRYRQMITQTIDRLTEERQFDEAPITLGDLARIREALVVVLVGMNHHRIEYPRPSPESRT
jgi:cyclic-di-AMP phosphodiesterase PgpH